MTSSFMGLYVQRNALMLSQKALDITGNNISNINTAGYTRQRVDICSVAIHKNTLGYGNVISLAGRGSDAIGVAQIRDRIRDKQVRAYSGDLCNVGVKVSTLSDIEDIFDSIEADSSDNEASFAAIVNKLKKALQNYTTDHADRSEMASIAMNTAESLVQALRNYDLDLDKVAEDVLEDAKSTVTRINAILAEMGNLNKQIKDAYISMGYITSTNGNYQVQNDYGPLELKDKMNLLLDELSQYGNIEFKEESDGTFTVRFADQLVVSEKYYAQMAMAELNPTPTNMAFIVTTGEVDENGIPINGGLYDKDQWYNMNVQNGTGGDSSFLVRELLRGETVDFSGRNVLGNYYLDAGALRGYLDMYNGRGLFVGEPGHFDYSSIEKQLEVVNNALDKLATGLRNQTLSTDDLNRIIDTLRDSLGATVERTEDGNYIVTANDVVIFNSAEGYVYKELSYKNPDPQNRGNIQIIADDTEVIRTISANEYTGIEYYRDLLNAFVKTLADEFNAVYGDIPNPDYDPDDPNSQEFIKLFDYGDDFRNAAKNLRLTDIWLNNPEILANPTGQNEYEELDNTYLHKLLALFTNDLTYSDGLGHKVREKFSLDKFVQYINQQVGSKLDGETGVYDATDIMLTGVEYERSQVMDVSINEEGINMMNYQKWYNAISRMISTLDEALDKLINQTGLVGLR